MHDALSMMVRVASDEIDSKFISRLCKKVNGRTGLAFGGNCGMFALGMCRFLSEHGFSGMKIVFSVDGSDFVENESVSIEDLMDELDMYHVAFKVGNDIYDGDGKITIN